MIVPSDNLKEIRFLALILSTKQHHKDRPDVDEAKTRRNTAPNGENKIVLLECSIITVTTSYALYAHAVVFLLEFRVLVFHIIFFYPDVDPVAQQTIM